MLHAVEDESQYQYYGLSSKTSKCAVISTSGRRDVCHMKIMSHTWGLLTRHVGNRPEVANACAPFSKTQASLSFYYNSMIRSNLFYGLETMELTQSLLSRLENFQLRGCRKILNMHTTSHNAHRPWKNEHRSLLQGCCSRCIQI